MLYKINGTYYTFLQLSLTKLKECFRFKLRKQLYITSYYNKIRFDIVIACEFSLQTIISM